jgi:hypothetical protein
VERSSSPEKDKRGEKDVPRGKKNNLRVIITINILIERVFGWRKRR